MLTLTRPSNFTLLPWPIGRIKRNPSAMETKAYDIPDISANLQISQNEIDECAGHCRALLLQDVTQCERGRKRYTNGTLTQGAVSGIMQIDNSFENESEKVAESERN